MLLKLGARREACGDGDDPRADAVRAVDVVGRIPYDHDVRRGENSAAMPLGTFQRYWNQLTADTRFCSVYINHKNGRIQVNPPNFQIGHLRDISRHNAK